MACKCRPIRKVGVTTCEKCYQNQRRCEKNKYHRRVGAGQCIRCKVQLPPSHKPKSCDACREARNKRMRNLLAKKRLEVFGRAKCVCCGEDRLLFLTLDHIN